MRSVLKRWLGRAPERLRCPYCKDTVWYRGPSGGISTNIMCANEQCQHWFSYHDGLIPMGDLHQVGRDRRPVRE